MSNGKKIVRAQSMHRDLSLSREQIIKLLTFLTFALAFMGFLLETKVKEPVVLLFSFVTLGTAIDFLSSIIGAYTQNRALLLAVAKIRFSLLNFGILFTPISAAFIVSNFSTAHWCVMLANNYLPWLIFSLTTGSLFLFTKYTLDREEGVPIFKLDQDNKFTVVAFIIRRILLLSSLIIALLVILEGLKTEFAVWTILFGGSFILTIPLHIMKKHLSSMAVEFITLIILFYGAAHMYLQ